MIDRLAPTRRPSGPPRGYQQWRSLFFLHWPVATDILRPLVPAPLELDPWDGQVYVGLVPFRMGGVRPAWCPPALAFQFLETNVRTYVLHRGEPGVYFFSLDASSRIAVAIARRFWSLPYFHAHMEWEQQGDVVTYRSQRAGSRAKCFVRGRLGEAIGESRPGSPEFFFLERYLLFAQRGERIARGQVHHQPYPAQRVAIESLEDELVAATGLPAVAGLPAFAHYAAGVDVEIFPLVRQ
jgi:uncharacterized protein